MTMSAGERETLERFANDMLDKVKERHGIPGDCATLEAFRPIFVWAYVTGARDMLDSIESAGADVRRRFDLGQLRAAIAAKLSNR
jgi:hypothetical protein